MPLSVEDHLPAVLTTGPMTDEQFAELCSEHPDLFFEMTAEGELIIMPPNYSFTGAQQAEILGQLANWAAVDQRGITTDASAGFHLPNGARRSADAAWTAKARLQNLEGFWHLSPDFIVEVRSQTDRLSMLRGKMQEWIANGAKIAWLIDPDRRAVEIFQPDTEPEILTHVDTIAASAPVEGFVLDLRPVWDPFRT